MEERDRQELLDALSDIPVPEIGETGMQADADLLQILLTKEEITAGSSMPAIIKNIMLFYVKTLPLSNLESSEMKGIMRGFDDTKLAVLMSRPKGRFTAEEEVQWTALRNWVDLEKTRGRGGFERAMQATQIQQITTDQAHSIKRNESGGVGGMLKGLMPKGD